MKKFRLNIFTALLPIVVVAIIMIYDAVAWDGYLADPRFALITGAIIATIVGIITGKKWSDTEERIHKNLSEIIMTILILMCIGLLIAAFTISGILPSLVYYGTNFVTPELLLPVTFILCAVVSLALGSSWTTAAIIGLPLVIIGGQIGVSEAWVAGAVVSGAYFGDKLSPMSDTTNLAAGIAGANLFDHVRAMLKPSVVAAGAALILFTGLGFMATTTGATDLSALQAALNESFVIRWWLTLPILLIVPIFLFKPPTIPALLGLVGIGALLALSVQGIAIQDVIGQLLWGTYVEAGEVGLTIPNFDRILSSGGIDGMTWTITLVITAMIFAASLEANGIIDRIMQPFKRLLRSDRTLVATTGVLTIVTNALTADQYVGISMPYKLVEEDFLASGLDPTVMSKTLEGAGTVSSALIPWSSCGAFMAGTLGVATFSYLPFAFFNLFSIIIAIGAPLLGIGLLKKEQK